MPCSQIPAPEGATVNNCRQLWENLPLNAQSLGDPFAIERIRQNERVRMAHVMARAFADQAMNAQQAPKGLKERINDVLFIAVIALVVAVAFLLIGAMGYGVGHGIVALLGL